MSGGARPAGDGGQPGGSAGGVRGGGGAPGGVRSGAPPQGDPVARTPPSVESCEWSYMNLFTPYNTTPEDRPQRTFRDKAGSVHLRAVNRGLVNMIGPRQGGWIGIQILARGGVLEL